LRAALAFLLLVPAFSQETIPDWQQELRRQITNQQLDAALGTVEQRLASHPEDGEAHGWRARVLAWRGRWSEAETEYRRAIEQSPSDTELLAGVADVLLWQGKLEEALHAVDRALNLGPEQTELLTRRARILRGLGRTSEARKAFRQVLELDPKNAEARNGLRGLAEQTRHELRFGVDIDTFNYTDAAQTQALTLRSNWKPRWSTLLGANFYQRFGENPGKIVASTAFRLTPKDWLNMGGAFAPDNGVIPTHEAFVEYGHGFKFQNGWIPGLETSVQQRWLWFRAAHVRTLGVTQIYYLPKDWTWTLALTGARSGFAGTGVEWVPSGSTRFGFPVFRDLDGNVSFAVGTENFAQVDQIGRFSARTFAGGLHYRISPIQDIAGYVAVQNRSQDRQQNSFGLSYGFRF
jgi:tetratricopeptide (TPR) repeat protein